NAGTLDYLTPSMIKTLDSVDEDIEIYFMYQGKLIRIMIPKNMDISKYVDKNGFIGFLQLKKIIESGAFVIA
ncbi:MAG: hypothetical protein J6N21_12355, partial [Butyrivibrio sp.]|nr:hypothetical protein [Butyrivibrio sp.]